MSLKPARTPSRKPTHLQARYLHMPWQRPCWRYGWVGIMTSTLSEAQAIDLIRRTNIASAEGRLLDLTMLNGRKLRECTTVYVKRVADEMRAVADRTSFWIFH